MRAGKYGEGEKVLRAKVDMSAPNMQLRDPLMYRIKHAPHHRTGTAWCIYPLYDFAHGQSDAIEQVTHSCCSLEYVSHRRCMTGFIEKLEIFPSHQYEFSRLNLTYTVMSQAEAVAVGQRRLCYGLDDPGCPRSRVFAAGAIRPKVSGCSRRR